MVSRILTLLNEVRLAKMLKEDKTKMGFLKFCAESEMVEKGQASLQPLLCGQSGQTEQDSFPLFCFISTEET